MWDCTDIVSTALEDYTVRLRTLLMEQAREL
jgi:hypothetical protein